MTGPHEQSPYPPGPQYPPPQPAASPTNGLAIASMVVSLLSIPCVGCLIPGIAGAVMGHVARRQIRERGQQGDGFAKTGVIVGWVVTGLGVAAWATVLILGFTGAFDEPTY